MNKGERQTFSKNERLCSIKLIDEVFTNGNVFHTSLFKVIWSISSTPLSSPAQIAVSVPKKSFRHAVARNLIKRRIREAYRKKKQILYSILQLKNIQIAFVIIYRYRTAADYPIVEKSVGEVIEKLCAIAGKQPQKS